MKDFYFALAIESEPIIYTSNEKGKKLKQKLNTEKVYYAKP